MFHSVKQSQHFCSATQQTTQGNHQGGKKPGSRDGLWLQHWLPACIFEVSERGGATTFTPGHHRRWPKLPRWLWTLHKPAAIHHSLPPSSQPSACSGKISRLFVCLPWTCSIQPTTRYRLSLTPGVGKKYSFACFTCCQDFWPHSDFPVHSTLLMPYPLFRDLDFHM